MKGVSGPIKFQNNHRVGVSVLLQFSQSKFQNSTSFKSKYGCYFSKTGVFGYDSDNSNKTIVELNHPDVKDIEWKSGRLPLDSVPKEEYCTIEPFRAFLGVECSVALTILNILAVFAFVLFLLVVIIVVRNRYEKKVKATQDRMKELGILSDANWLSLDQWEMNRSDIVHNRKLGQGAFGTVFGGEAFHNDSWQACAVKTLKPGSSTTDKIDFLSEAELMKRFNHDNIIKLIGVCTRGEPVLVAMECMLHGDLKTFLLARRHLVGRSDAEEVSIERLNKMARDICRGVDYLARNHYVHRDIACRNCLVHENLTVKLSDFGMTRPIFDQGYYRFSRRAMLPVRWMPPESITEGIFTSKSDVWSLGVVIFEIATFGSYPFQGLTNKQVIDHIQCGNTLCVPSNFPPDLFQLLQECWAFQSDERPTAYEILKRLEKNDLIVPCLDDPASAVEPEEEEQTGCTVAPKTIRQRSLHRISSIHSEHAQVATSVRVKPAHDIPRTSTANSMPEQTASLMNGTKTKPSIERYSDEIRDDRESSDISRGLGGFV